MLLARLLQPLTLAPRYFPVPRGASDEKSRVRIAGYFRHAVLAVGLGLAFSAAAAEPADSGADVPPRNVNGISDNSFLIEEAYNQGPGVVQHILTGFYNVNRLGGSDDKALDLSFTQEWPLWSQTHQLSYTVPYFFTRSGGQSDNGIGDVLLHYRYQAYYKEETLTAFAPRLSAILPTGDTELGFGENDWGVQVNLPFSTTLGPNWFFHANAGATFLRHPASTPGRELWHYNLGASLIYAPSRDLHFLLEWIGNWDHVERPSGGMKHEFVSLISPGVRKAFNYANDSQLVVGVAAPVGITGSAPDFGVFLYVSFEHFFSRKHLQVQP